MVIPLNVGRSSLLNKCIQVIDTYDPKRTTVDAWVEDSPVLDPKDKSLGDIERKFIHQIFYGCIRYQKFLKQFVTSFLYKSPALALRSEQTLYMVLSYMLFFRLEELGVQEFRQFLNCGAGTLTALLALLQYALNVDELEKWVKMEWCKHYDVRYIEEDVIGRLQHYADELRPVVEEVEFKATGTVKGGDTIANMPEKRKQTEPVPFNLTKPKPRLIPEPEVISREVKALPVNPVIHKTSLEQVEDEKRKRLEEQRSRVADKYSVHTGPNLETANRRDGGELEELSRKVDAERMAECTFKPKPAKKYVPPTEEAPIRQNIAAVLREDALLKQKQANEYQTLKRYEEDLHDASEFYRWQDDMKQKDHLEEEKRVQQRIVEMQLAREGAIEASEADQRKKKILADHYKEILAAELEAKEKQAAVDLEQKQQLVEETIAERANAKVVMEEVVVAKAENAEQLRKEKEAEFERKKREDEHEMERKKDLIRQIRALEKVPVSRFKMFDPAEAPCQGLLEEMSLAELRERVKIMEAHNQKELEDKRERQLEKKLEKQQELAEKAETLAKIRERAKEESQQRHSHAKKKQQELEEQQAQHREQCIVEVSEKIQQKKAQKLQEEQRLKKELREISMKRQFLAADAAMVEARGHGEQHRGLEREAKNRQKGLLIEQRRKNEIMGKEARIRHDNRQSDAEAYKAMTEAVNDRVRRAKVADAALKDEILKAATSARTSQKTIERKNTAEFGHSSNRYMQRVSKMSVSA
mmetsp:Transcript_99109/g.212345  ORF Transcript_99109/g.212345 Transcript_99109/m.212345 type:complete len:757 (-) Transcript_99109:76-2346(-)